jgi:hypothetical protein
MSDENKAAAELTQPNVIAKLNIKSIGCQPKAAAALPVGDMRHIYLARIIGMAGGLIQGETELGEYFALSGKFQGTNMQEGSGPGYGETYESGVCYLPPGIHETLVTAVRAAGLLIPEKSDKRSTKVMLPIKSGETINFAIDIFVKQDTNASGITYIGKPILPPTAADPLAQIRLAIADVEGKLKQLNAAGSAPGGKSPRQIEGAKSK